MSGKNSVTKISTGVIAVLGGSVLIVALILFAALPWNDALLRKMERTLSNLEIHPHDSEVVKTYRFLGSRYTNTSECTFAVGQWRISKFGSDALHDIYANPVIETSLRGEKVSLGFMLIEEDSHLTLEDPPDEWHTIIREQTADSAEEYTHYLLYLYIPGRSSLGDMRCLEGNATESESNKTET